MSTRQENVMSLSCSFENPRSHRMCTCRAWRLGVLIHQWIECLVCVLNYLQNAKKKKRKAPVLKKKIIIIQCIHIFLSPDSQLQYSFLTKLLLPSHPLCPHLLITNHPTSHCQVYPGSRPLSLMSAFESHGQLYQLYSHQPPPQCPWPLFPPPCQLPVSSLGSTMLPSILWINIH